MLRITNLCDQTTRFSFESFKKLSPNAQRFAWVVALFVGISALGVVASVLWKKLRPIDKNNEEQQVVDNISKKIIPVENDQKIDNPEIDDSATDDSAIDDFKIDSLETNDLETTDFTEIQPSDAQTLQQFSSADLVTFRGALINKKKVEIDDFVVWYNSFVQAINIQNKSDYNGRSSQQNKLGININEKGNITSIWIDGKELLNKSIIVPDNFLPRLHTCFKKVLELTSTYKFDPGHYQEVADAPIKIEIIRRGVKQISEFHLEKLCGLIKQGIGHRDDPKIRVKFLEDDLKGSKGSDEGGLSRDYLNDLVEGLTECRSLSFEILEKSSLALPRTKKDKLDSQEIALYQQIGQLMMYCYNSQVVIEKYDEVELRIDELLLGRHFDDSLFKAVLCLTTHEINSPFEWLSLDVQLKISQKLAEAKGMEKQLNWYQDFSFCGKQELQEIATQLLYADYLSKDLKNVNDEPDIDKIMKNRNQLKICLEKYLFSQDGVFGPFFAPIHNIAKGMKSICHPGFANKHNHNDDWHWQNTICRTDYRDVSKKIQGSLDKNEIANKIELDADLRGLQRFEIQKKVTWLQEWIRDEATEEEIKKFVIFVTGVSGVPKSKKITVKAQDISKELFPAPVAHTCVYEMWLAPERCGDADTYHDHTKEAFIRCLKECALTGASVYQIA